MKAIFVFACLQLAVALATPSPGLTIEWEDYKVKYGKVYNNWEVDYLRKLVYLNTKQFVEKHNAKYNKGLVSFELGINQFADMLTEEVSEKLNGNIMDDSGDDGSQIYKPHNTTARKNVDWRKKGVVTPVKNQGFCGSCWAFSATGSLEGQHALKTGKLVSLSEQQLVDCSSSYGNHGCKGGSMVKAFKYIHGNGGIDTESSYPYNATVLHCSFKKKNVGATDKSFVRIRKGSEHDLLKAVSEIGPISVGLHGDLREFQLYKDGVFSLPKCNSSRIINHAALVVGYGEFKGKPCWIVKNSWGTHWGKKGYFTVERNKNQLGIANGACYPVV